MHNKLFFRILLISISLSSIDIFHSIYSQPVTQEWVSRWPDNSPNSALSFGIKQDSSGNIYVLSDTSASLGYLKYDPNGNLLMHPTYKPTGYTNSKADYFDVNQDGTVYITGRVWNNFNYWIITLKYYNNGLLHWVKIYNPDNIDTPVGIKIDKENNVVVCGEGSISSISYLILIKYNNNGDTLLNLRFNNNQSYINTSNFVVDHDNNIIITGDILSQGYKTFVCKFNSHGELLWLKIFTLTIWQGYPGSGVCLNFYGNYIYVVGSQNRSSYIDSYLLKVDKNNGDSLWCCFYERGWSSGELLGPVISTDGNSIYYTASPKDTIGSLGSNIATLKYNSSGVQQWVRLYNGGLINTLNLPSGIKLDKLDNVYISGFANYPNTGDDFITLKYSPEGLLKWNTRYTGLVTNGIDQAKDILVDTLFNLYATGISKKANYPDIDAVSIKYNQPMGISTNNNDIPIEYKLFQNYPNPFNSITIINYSLPKESIIELIIYDIMGRNIQKLVDWKQDVGNYSIALNMENISSGIYFYCLKADGKIIDTKKFILIK